MTTTFEREHECKDFEYYCDGLKRCCTHCGTYYRFDDKKRMWVKE